jgi:hypothetical protein
MATSTKPAVRRWLPLACGSGEGSNAVLGQVLRPCPVENTRAGRELRRHVRGGGRRALSPAARSCGGDEGGAFHGDLVRELVVGEKAGQAVLAAAAHSLSEV